MKERYLRSVRGLLDCPSAERERLLSRLGSAVTAYWEDNPEADETDFIRNFGTPEECAARLQEECGPGVVTAERRKKTRRHRILEAVLAVLLVAAVGIAAYLWKNGGWVTIYTYDGKPDYWDSLPSNHIIYDYDD